MCGIVQSVDAGHGGWTWTQVNCKRTRKPEAGWTMPIGREN